MFLLSFFQLAASGLSRSKDQLIILLDSLYLGPFGPTELALQSNFETIKLQKRKPTGEEVENVIKASEPGKESIHDIVISGLVELCKVKPVGLDAVKWLGEWLLANNPNKPSVDELEAE